MTTTPPPVSAELDRYASELRSAAGGRGHRAVLVLSGTAEWCREQARKMLASCRCCCWLGGDSPGDCVTLDWKRARTRLGGEADCLVIDAHGGFDAEGFGALVGTVSAGGVVLLLIPPAECWPVTVDSELSRLAPYPYDAAAFGGRFLTRLLQVMDAQSTILRWEQGGPRPTVPMKNGSGALQQRGELYANKEQHEAVEAISHVATGHRHRPLVISADRGRGKSTALGIAAAQLLERGWQRIVVTAPRIGAVATLFEHAGRLLPESHSSRGKVMWREGGIQFVPPDALLQELPEAQLLLIDEAAAIPSPLLERMLRSYSRIVFATTIHGYEGTGRGFAVRFRKVLEQRTPGWRALHLSTPVRWAEGDPLEAFAFRALLLDAEPPQSGTVASATLPDCHFESVDRERLLASEQDLGELFGLLVLAHYRTSPNDVRQLLDAPELSLYVMRYQGHIVATAIVVAEGGLDAELAEQVFLGRRRVQGHLLPQSLANHAGFAEAASCRVARVMRIAVHPALQGRGIGSEMLQQIEHRVRLDGFDLVGASFGATVELLHFWRQQGLLPVRLGLGREASSGSHSAQVVKPLSQQGEQLFLRMYERFAETLPELLGEPLANLEPAIAECLVQLAPPVVHESLSEQDKRDLYSFAYGLRGYELCILAIRKLVLQVSVNPRAMENLTAAQQRLLHDKVLQRHDWPQVVQDGGYPGRKAALKALREAVCELLNHCIDAQVLNEWRGRTGR